MKPVSMLILLCGLCLGAAVNAADKPPVEALRSTVMSDAGTFGFNASMGNGLKAIDDAERGQTDLDALVAPALAAAHDHSDLAVAIKAFYVAAKTYFDSAYTPVPPPNYEPGRTSRPSPEAVALKTTRAKLKADLDSKANALQLEVQLAGIAGAEGQ